MKNHLNKARGFTLVEILMVVMLLGILAAIVVPKFSSASDQAQRSNLTSTLRTLRSQIQLYRVQHNSTYPALTEMWTNLTDTTDIDGDTSGAAFGPYLEQLPKNPFANSSTVAADNSAAWQYDASTGAILAVVDATTAAQARLDPSDYVAAP